jgi:hypothetical protein
MSQDDSNRAKLARLADALVKDIMATSDADIIAEVDRASIERARTILIEVKANLSRRQLADAKAQLEAWRTAQSRDRHSLDRATARDRFEKIRRADPAFNQKMSMAARNGREPTDSDKEGLIEDWADLQRLDEQDTLE